MDGPQPWRRRCEGLAVHLRKSATSHSCVVGDATSAPQSPRYIDEAGRGALGAELRRLFGLQASCSGPLAASGLGCRLTGVNLAGAQLSPDQATFLLDAVARFGIVCIAGQDLERFTLQDFERLANYWGAPYPHPSNFTRDGVLASEHGPTEGEVEWVPFADRRASGVNRAFPGELQCLPHESPAVLIASNVSSGRGETKGDGAPGLGSAQAVIKTGGGNWHTDIEYDPLPLSTSMFCVHRVPTSRRSSAGTWVEPGGKEDTRVDAPMVESTVEAVHGVVSDPELLRLRRALPLNGETAFADTAAAFAALSPSEQELLSRTRVVRRVNPGDAGTISPLVVANPRTGVRSLHSPIFDARPGVRPAIQVDGMSVEDSRLFLDRLEAHCLQPCFRYDHLHTPGDVTIWDLFSTLHCIPPQLRSVNSLGDVRLLYRISTKGEPCIELPRKDDEDWLSEHIAGGWRTELAPSHTV